jgi:hypothetical protein
MLHYKLDCRIIHLKSSMGCTTTLWTLSGSFSSQLVWHDLLSIFALHYHTTLWALSGSFFSQLVWHDLLSITICKIVVAPNVLRPWVLGLQCLLFLNFGWTSLCLAGDVLVLVTQRDQLNTSLIVLLFFFRFQFSFAFALVFLGWRGNM